MVVLKKGMGSTKKNIYFQEQNWNWYTKQKKIGGAMNSIL